MHVRYVVAALAVLAILCLVMAWAVSDARAQLPACAPTEEYLDFLADRFGEVPAFIATTSAGVVTVTVNDDTGTWSMLLQRRAEVVCMVSSGERWAPAPDVMRERWKPGTPL